MMDTTAEVEKARDAIAAHALTLPNSSVALGYLILDVLLHHLKNEPLEPEVLERKQHFRLDEMQGMRPSNANELRTRILAKWAESQRESERRWAKIVATGTEIA